MPKISPEAWKALEIAQSADHDLSLEIRLEQLQQDLDDGRARRVGSSILMAPQGVPAQTTLQVIRAQTEFSVLSPSVTIDGNSTVHNSLVQGTSSVTDFSDVQASSVKNTNVVNGSSVNNSEVEGSILSNSRVFDSKVDNAELTYSTVVGDSHINDAVLHDVSTDDTTLSFRELHGGISLIEADLSNDRHFMDFGSLIGTRHHVYAYRLRGGGLRIQAGCQQFDSTRAMLAYAKTADRREYINQTPEKVALFMKQIRGMAALIRATQRLW